jgi:hypothetical protein
MLKWILGIIVALALLIGGSCYFGYRELTSEGPTASVNLAGVTPEQAWSYLTVPDSMQTWRDSTTRLTTSRDSALTLGDTVRLTSVGRSNRSSDLTWVLHRIEPYRVIEWVSASNEQDGNRLHRLDSLVPTGDSLRLSSTFLAPSMDSMAAADSIGKMGRGLLSSAGKMLVGVMRLMAQDDLERLKQHIN